MNLLIISGIWCGDCVQQCPLIARIAETNPEKISLRLLDRDQHRDLIESFRLNAGDRVPIVLFLAEDFEFCRRLRRAHHQPLPQPSPSDISAPPAPPASSPPTKTN